MNLRNIKKDFSNFSRAFGESSTDENFKLSDCKDFNIIWQPLGTVESKLEKDALLKNTELYQKYSSHLLTRYRVKSSKKGELG